MLQPKNALSEFSETMSLGMRIKRQSTPGPTLILCIGTGSGLPINEDTGILMTASPAQHSAWGGTTQFITRIETTQE